MTTDTERPKAVFSQFRSQPEQTQANAVAKRAKNASRPKHNGHPSTSEMDYTPEEWEFMSAVMDLRAKTGRSFPTWREVFGVVKSLGYDRAPRPGFVPATD